jgi:hypothetical protein
MSIGDSKKPSRAGNAGTAGHGGAGGGKPPADARAPSAARGPTATGPQSGRVQFDERGNAIWEWAIATGAFGREVSTERLQKLENPGLSLAEDAPTPSQRVKANPLGAVKGYNPYDSGKLGKPREAPKKKDLKKLSDWLQLKKQAANNDPETD